MTTCKTMQDPNALGNDQRSTTPNAAVTRRVARLLGLIDPRRKAILVAPVVASLFVFLLSLLHLFNMAGLEDKMQAYAIKYMRNYMPDAPFSSRIKIVLIPEVARAGARPSGDIDRTHRAFFAELVREMTSARAKIVAFDIAFDKPSPFDQAFGAAVAEAESKGVKIISGFDKYLDGGAPDPRPPPGVPLNRLGLIVAGGSQEEGGPIGTVLLASPSPNASASEPSAIPSFPLRIVMDLYEPPLSAEFDGWGQSIRLFRNGEADQVRIPLEGFEGLLLDQASESELGAARIYVDKLPFGDPAAMVDYEDAIVLVGYEHSDLTQTISGERRLGLELHATAVSNILNRVFISKLSLSMSLLIITVMSFLGAFLHTRAGRFLEFRVPIPIPFTALQLPIPLGVILLSLAYVIVAFAVYKLGRIYLDVCYHIAALLISYGGLWFILNKWFPIRKKETLWTVD